MFGFYFIVLLTFSFQKFVFFALPTMVDGMAIQADLLSI